MPNLVSDIDQVGLSANSFALPISVVVGDVCIVDLVFIFYKLIERCFFPPHSVRGAGLAKTPLFFKVVVNELPLTTFISPLGD